MSRVTVIGSGPSGVHFARTLLDKGIGVTMIDAGRKAPSADHPDADFTTALCGRVDASEEGSHPVFKKKKVLRSRLCTHCARTVVTKESKDVTSE